MRAAGPSRGAGKHRFAANRVIWSVLGPWRHYTTRGNSFPQLLMEALRMRRPRTRWWFPLTGLALCLGLALPARAGQDEEPPPFRFKVYRPGQAAIEVMTLPGELATIRDAAGITYQLRVEPAPEGRLGARVEVIEKSASGEGRETFEVQLGERVTAKRLGQALEIELVAGPVTADQRRSATRYEVELKLSGGRTAMAVGSLAPVETIWIADDSGMQLGFRPVVGKGAGPARVEVVRQRQEGESKPFRWLKNVNLGGSFILTENELGLRGGSDEIVVRGAIRLADPEMWDGTAQVHGFKDVVHLRARWNGSPWIEGVAYGGELFRVAPAGFAGEIGFAPSPSASAAEGIGLTVFQITRVGKAEALREMERVDLMPGSSALIRALEGLLEVQFVNRRPPLLKGTCWLSCGGGAISVHSCAASCDSIDCCTGRCCSF